MTPLPEPTQAERETAIAVLRSVFPLARPSIDGEVIGAIADALARHRIESTTDAALRYLTGPCAFEEDHAREIIEQVRGGEVEWPDVRAILGMQ